MSALKIVVVGLGYVGLPLAAALAKHFDTLGFDVSADRVEELRAGHDRTGEIDASELPARLRLTATAEEARAADLYILTVPTPVDSTNRPDLGPLLRAARTVGGLLDASRRPTIVVESTVYPGVSETIVGPEIARSSGLAQGEQFSLGYSPERITPGDREHRIEAITKVIAATDAPTLELMEKVYGAITGGNVFRAASIRVAESAKVIENAQRDINIAFMNEVAQIVAKLGVSVWDVLAAAQTKWNFLPFEPGLVGGHCIGVDPYYLSFRALQLGHSPQVILAGRDINDSMGAWVADRLHERRGGRLGTALVMGLTFKENVRDLRNSRVVDVIKRLEWLGHSVDVTDPLASPDEAAREYGLTLLPLNGKRYDIVVGAVRHDEYRAMGSNRLAELVADGGIVADLKNMWRSLELPAGIERWSL